MMKAATINEGWQTAADNARPGGGANLLWFQVAPWGRTPGRSGIQIFDQGAAARITAAFDNAKAKAGTSWRGVPIHIGFPMLNPSLYKDDKKYGSVVSLLTREDGLYALAKWSTAGREIVEDEQFCFANPLCDTEPVPGQPGAVRPVALISVGLTNAASPGAVPLGVIGANDAADAAVFPLPASVPFLPKEGEGRPYKEMFFRAVDNEMQALGTVFNQAYTRCQTTHRGTFEAYLRECEAVQSAKLRANTSRQR